MPREHANERGIRTSLRPFVPAIDDFYARVMLRGLIQESRIAPYFRKWRRLRGEKFAGDLRAVLQGLLDVAAGK